MTPRILRRLSPKRLIWPIVLGLGVVTWLFIDSFDREAFARINWTWRSLVLLILAFGCMFVRDIAYMYRMRLLTGGRISYRRSLGIALLWEFGSAVTPASLGGSPLAVLLLSKSGLGAGRSTAVVMFCLFLDGLVLILAIPLLVIILGRIVIAPPMHYFHDIAIQGIVQGLIVASIVSFCIYTTWTAILGYGLFVNPKGIKRLLYRVFSMRFLKRWQKGAIRAGSDIIIASAEIREKTAWYWLRAFIATACSWTGRFMVAIMLLMMFFPGTIDWLLVMGRQAIMQVLLMSTPTPGASGIAELSLPTFLVEYVPGGLEAPMSLLWRGITYYMYLFIGVYLLPRWLKRLFSTGRGNA